MAEQGSVDSKVSIHLAEYKQLRSEINNRTQLSAGLVALQMTVLGAGLSLVDDLPDVIIALALVSSFLWLLWIDHTSQIYKIAAYLSMRIATDLRMIAPGVLGWEAFMRSLDQGGSATEKALFGSSKGRRVLWLRTQEISRYISFLFGVTPLLLIAGFIISHHAKLRWGEELMTARAGLIVLAAMLWFFSLRRYRSFVGMRSTIDEAILEHEHKMAEQMGKKGGASNLLERTGDSVPGARDGSVTGS